MGIEVDRNSTVGLAFLYNTRDGVFIDKEDKEAIRKAGIKDSPGSSKTRKWAEREERGADGDDEGDGGDE